MENSPENQLAIIILKIGFHLELAITSTSVSGVQPLVAPTTERPVSMELPSEKELSNNVISSECDRDKINEEHNTKDYDFKELEVDEASHSIANISP